MEVNIDSSLVSIDANRGGGEVEGRGRVNIVPPLRQISKHLLLKTQ